MATIKRDDAIYLEIEQFEDYELTNNLAFEMAVRNDEVKRCIEYIIEDPFTLETDATQDMVRYGFKYPFIGARHQKHFNISDKQKEILRILEMDQREIPNDADIAQVIKTNGITFSSSILTSMGRNSAIKRGVEAKIYATINTKRPLMMMQSTAKIVNTSFNMALSLDELIAQISIIKKEFDNNFSNIKSTAELLDHVLEIADREVCNSNGKCFDPRGYLTKQQKMADMFFIYDCLKAGINKTTIKHQIYEYHLKNEVDKPLDDKTLYKYRDIAIKYIDNFGYKELLTGVKSI